MAQLALILTEDSNYHHLHQKLLKEKYLNLLKKMDKHLPEKNLDKILEGKMSPDELENFWQWLSVKMAAASTNLEDYWNMYYLQHMRAVFFEACIEHPQYQKFYVNNLMALDGRRTLPQQFLQNQQQNNIEIIELLQEQLATKDLPQPLQDEINLIITNLSDEVQTQEVGE